MRAFLATLIVCLCAFAVPASAHTRPLHPMVRGLAHGLIHMMESARQPKPLFHERHHIAHRRDGHRYAEHRLRKFAQPQMAAAFLPFEPGPFSMLFGAGQTAVTAGVDAGLQVVDAGTRVAFGISGAAIAGASAVADRVRAAALSAGVPPSIALAVARLESNYRMNLRGRAGEIGVMQVLPRTAAAMGENPYTLDGNLRAGMKYLRLALDRGGAGCSGISLYNLGIAARPVCTSYGRRVLAMAGIR